MKIYYKELKLHTKNRYDFINIEKEVEKFVKESKIRDGILIIFLPHATFSIYFNENEERLKKDVVNFIKDNFEKREYLHNQIDNNAHAHLANLFLKPFLIIPIINGSLYKGIWQNILLLELDYARIRKALLMILGNE